MSKQKNLPKIDKNKFSVLSKQCDQIENPQGSLTQKGFPLSPTRVDQMGAMGAPNSRKKKFVCESCGKRFTRKDNMSVHRRTSCQVLKDHQLVSKIIEQLNLEAEASVSPQNIKPFKDNTIDRLKLVRESFNGGEKLSEGVHIVRGSPTTQLENYRLPSLQEIAEKVMILEKDLKEKSIQIEELKDKPSINNNLQIVCISANDNYLDMLTEKWGDYDRALEYIKDCALSSLTGDCKLIEKIYLGDSQSISYIDKSRVKIEYFDENRNKVIDPRGLNLAKKLANNLQNSYLKGINYLINHNLENKRCPNKFLEEYDIQLWNQHIYDLSDHRYHRKIISHLNIPTL